MKGDVPLSAQPAQPKPRPRKIKQHVSCLHCGPLTLDLSTSTVTKGDRVIKLTPKETQLLTAFMSHPGEVISHKLLIKEIWHTDFTDDMRMLYVHIRLLRKKIEDDPSRPQLVQIVRSRGYRFAAPQNEATL